jgi:adenosine deaminase
VVKPVGTVTEASAWVRQLPKIELHLHLEGAIRPSTMRELSVERLGWSGPLPEGWEHTYYTYTDFSSFMAQLTPRFPGRPDEYARIARECFEDLARLGVVYAEVSVDAPTREVGDDSRFWPIVEALEQERRLAEARFPIRINWILALMRTLPVEVALWRTRLAIEARDRGIAVVAIDLHGDEQNAPPAPFAPAYRLAADAGLSLRAHAGEASDPRSIWDAIEVLGATRIAHGVRAIEDPALLARLRRGDVTLEICPTSNVRTAVVPDLRAHPIRRLYELGVPVAVGSDDPLPFFTDIERENRLLVDELGFSRSDLQRITLNAAETAFLPESERATLRTLIEGAYSVPREQTA